MTILQSEIFDLIRGKCVSDESAKEASRLIADRFDSKKNQMQGCFQCVNWSDKLGCFEIACLECRRYHVDKFEPKQKAVNDD